jgi:hypothetical protein
MARTVFHGSPARQTEQVLSSRFAVRSSRLGASAIGPLPTGNCERRTVNRELLVAQSRSLCNVVGPMEAPRLQLSLLPDVLAVCRLEPSDPIPDWATRTGFFSVSRTRDQLSIVCANSEVGDDVRASRGWRAIKIEGPLDLDLVGILVSVAVPLAHAGIGILPIGTFDTDYILVRDRQLQQAIKALRATGFHIVD